MPPTVERPASSKCEAGNPLNALELFEREYDELKRAADRLIKLVSVPVWNGDEATAVEEALREMRRQMPAHFLKEEHILFPELGAAALLSPASGEELRRRHLAVEGEFVEVQAIALALGVTEPTRSLRRQILRAARQFKEELDDLMRYEESTLIIPGAAALPPEAIEWLCNKLDAASQREALKQLQAG